MFFTIFEKNDVFYILDFFEIFDFSLWGGEPGSGGLGEPGRAGSPGNPGRGQAGTAHRLLCNTVRTPKA